MLPPAPHICWRAAWLCWRESVDVTWGVWVKSHWGLDGEVKMEVVSYCCWFQLDLIDWNAWSYWSRARSWWLWEENPNLCKERRLWGSLGFLGRSLAAEQESLGSCWYGSAFLGRHFNVCLIKKKMGRTSGKLQYISKKIPVGKSC